MAMNANTKLVVAGIGFGMMLQNYSFFLGFWSAYLKFPEDPKCAGVSWWLGYDAAVCAIETVFACGMVLGAWYDGSRVLWWFFFVLHLIDAVPGYTAATIFLGTTIYSEDGQACLDAHPDNGAVAKLVWQCQAYFGYGFYVLFMVAIFYMVCIRKDDEDGVFLAEHGQNKLIIFGLGLIMMVQNFMFGQSFWGLFMELPIASSACGGIRFWLGYNAVVCVVETTFACGMMMAGWIDSSKLLFWIFWVLHAIDAVPGYTFAVIFLGQHIHSADGDKCAETHPGIVRRSNEVWLIQVAFYSFYVCCMLAITYFSAFKATGSFQLLVGRE